MGSFCRQMARDFELSVVIDEKLETRKISLDVTDTPVDQVMAMVAKRIGSELTITGDLYYVGNLDPEDRGLFCGRSTGMRPDDLQSAIQALLSTDGNLFVDQRGVMVVADKIGVINRVHEVIDMVEALDRDVWVCQYHLITVGRKALADIGVETAVVGTLAGGKSDVTFSAVMDAVAGDFSGKTISEPVFLVNDGEMQRFRMGSQVPIVTSQIDGQTGRLTESIQFREVGLTLETLLTGREGEKGALAYTLSDERVESYNEEGPVITGAEMTGTVDVESGGVYLLASYTASRDADGWSLLQRFGFMREDTRSVTQLWLRVAKVKPTARSGLSEGGPEFESEPISGFSDRIAQQSDWPSHRPEVRMEDEKAAGDGEEADAAILDILNSPQP